MYSPIQTNGMPINQKFKNIIWLIINNSLFRFTPPYLTFLENGGYAC